MELSEEEKKAIEFLKTFIKTEIDYCKLEKTDVTDILNVIKKQDNKIKFLIENEIVLKEMNRNQMKIIDKQQQEIEEEHKKWKELLHEYGVKCQEIEELKNNELDYTTIYINGVYEGKKHYKDKIREKINQLKEVADEDNPDIFTKIDAYEELLEDN